MFREGGFISVYHHPFGREVDPTGASLDQLTAVTQKGIEESKLSDDPKYQARMLFRFVNELQVGDRILAKDGTRQILGFGTIASPYQYSPTFAEVPLRNRRRWKRSDRTLDLNDYGQKRNPPSTSKKRQSRASKLVRLPVAHRDPIMEEDRMSAPYTYEWLSRKARERDLEEEQATCVAGFN
jgi:hypothetical protein